MVDYYKELGINRGATAEDIIQYLNTKKSTIMEREATGFTSQAEAEAAFNEMQLIDAAMPIFMNQSKLLSYNEALKKGATSAKNYSASFNSTEAARAVNQNGTSYYSASSQRATNLADRRLSQQEQTQETINSPYAPSAEKKSKTMPIIALVLAICSFFAAGIFTAIPAIIIARLVLKSPDYTEDARKLAKISFYLALAATILCVFSLALETIVLTLVNK